MATPRSAQRVTTEILLKTFVGVSEFRFAKTSAKLTADQVWDYKLPITKDSINFTQADPAINNGFIHGQAKPAWSTSEPGDINLTFNIPSIDDETTGWLYEPGGTVVSMKESDTEEWKLKGIKLTGKPIEGMVMMISEDRKHCLVIKNLKGYSAMQTDNISQTPISFNISSTLQGGVSEDTDGDVVFGELVKIQSGI